MTLLRKG